MAFHILRSRGSSVRMLPCFHFSNKIESSDSSLVILAATLLTSCSLRSFATSECSVTLRRAWIPSKKDFIATRSIRMYWLEANASRPTSTAETKLPRFDCCPRSMVSLGLMKRAANGMI